jgi:hypothetical protein
MQAAEGKCVIHGSSIDRFHDAFTARVAAVEPAKTGGYSSDT